MSDKRQVRMGKGRQSGCSRFVAHMQRKEMWEVMFPGTPYPYEWGGVDAGGVVTFGEKEKK
jgi:hypothetical protein